MEFASKEKKKEMPTGPSCAVLCCAVTRTGATHKYSAGAGAGAGPPLSLSLSLFKLSCYSSHHHKSTTTTATTPLSHLCLGASPTPRRRSSSIRLRPR
jgi:hypothetical protein